MVVNGEHASQVGYQDNLIFKNNMAFAKIRTTVVFPPRYIVYISMEEMSFACKYMCKLVDSVCSYIYDLLGSFYGKELSKKYTGILTSTQHFEHIIIIIKSTLFALVIYILKYVTVYLMNYNNITYCHLCIFFLCCMIHITIIN